ncbi:MAG: CRISPR-associated endonuclease Cas1, partial [Rhodospirillaceae bacterium]|nr:CRISPR-associated endonuclease Cas1 [Rhodospirillaceae bacterium]
TTEAELAGLAGRLDAAPDLDTLRGLEGAAAAAFLRAFCRLFAPALGFVERTRRPPRDPVNAALSLAYTLLHAEAVRAAWAAGLDPFVGFLHAPLPGRESLACDLVELARPAVDRWVWGLFRERTLRADHFTSVNGACLMGKVGRAAFYEAYEVLATTERRRLRHAAAALARAGRAAHREAP